MQTHDSRLAIVPYDPQWPDMFEAEASLLRRALGASALHIDHHGSTAVPGLGAKPIIDIQISVASLQPMALYKEPLLALGYVHVPHADDSFCPFFHKPAEWPHSHHVHVVQAGGDEEKRTLAFRDYLHDNAAIAKEYEALKRTLAQQSVANDADPRETYARSKTRFVEQIVATALREGYPKSR